MSKENFTLEIKPRKEDGTFGSPVSFPAQLEIDEETGAATIRLYTDQNKTQLGTPIYTTSGIDGDEYSFGPKSTTDVGKRLNNIASLRGIGQSGYDGEDYARGIFGTGTVIKYINDEIKSLLLKTAENNSELRDKLNNLPDAEKTKLGITERPDNEDDEEDDGGGDGDNPPAPLTPFTGPLTERITPEEPKGGAKRPGGGVGGSLIYPESLKELDQDYITFQAFEYEPQEIVGIKFEGGDPDPGNPVDGKIFLPINGDISDSNTVAWGPNNINPIQAAMFKLARNMIKGGNINIDLENIKETIIKEGGELSNIKEAVKTYFAQQAVSATGLLSRTNGAILNPNLRLLFNNPELRQFTFQFKLSPRSDREAITVRKIIRYFKQYMAVRRTAQEFFLVAPHVFKINYVSPGNEHHKSINKIKTCALLACNVQYAADGNYMTFNDEARTMTSYILTLNFNEQDPVYYDEYTDPEDVISY